MKANRTLILNTLLIVILFVSCKKEENNQTPTPTPTPTFTVGQSYQGGKIAYILQAGDMGYDANVPHGIIAATSDYSYQCGWGCHGTAISGADETDIGTGSQNTIDIINGCSELGIAARICADLELDGFSDWYLPSIDELYKLYINRVEIGGFTNGSYWSSTEYDSIFAWHFSFYYANGGSGGDNKGSATKYVRAVRAF